jgi:hypothetical protein
VSAEDALVPAEVGGGYNAPNTYLDKGVEVSILVWLAGAALVLEPDASIVGAALGLIEKHHLAFGAPER